MAEFVSLQGWIDFLVGIVALIILPKNLDTAWFLTPLEHQHAINCMQRDYIAHMDLDSDGIPIQNSNNDFITMRDITDVLKDWKKLLIIRFNILAVLPVTALTTFLPFMVQGMSYSGVKATPMSVPSFVVGTLDLTIIV